MAGADGRTVIPTCIQEMQLRYHRADFSGDKNKLLISRVWIKELQED